MEAEVEILEYDAPHIISLGSEMKQGYSAMTYMLEDEEGTALTLISEYEPSNFYYKIMYKLTGWISRGLTMEQMERLAECVEAAYHKEDFSLKISIALSYISLSTQNLSVIQ